MADNTETTLRQGIIFNLCSVQTGAPFLVQKITGLPSFASPKWLQIQTHAEAALQALNQITRLGAEIEREAQAAANAASDL